LEFGIWNLEFGIWNLEFGFWDLGFGFWDLEFGIWNLVFTPLPYSSVNVLTYHLTNIPDCNFVLFFQFIN